ncbi:MAG: helix-turn-helix transcriptional regulator [Ruminococcaceae bacterium]|nr:helix-turn-helix transcriptional regulator [Oscillospiraceae bacterium]
MKMSSNPAGIGERIKMARKAAKLSQTELARRLDKTMRTVQKYESGEIEPSIAMINAIAKELDVSPADLIGYRKPEIQLDTLSDVIAVLYQLNKKAGLRFEIDVQRPPASVEWSCSLRFNGNDHSADINSTVCLLLENFRDEREKLETYWTDQAAFDLWVEKELAYYADVKLSDREEVMLTQMERLQRRNELDRQILEEMRKAAEENGSPE